MQVKIKPGTYVVAVSGGVDSVALLHMLSAAPYLRLIVAHFDHGIRQESADDAHFVRDVAEKYALPFEMQRVTLGPSASEAVAREARYAFLHYVRQQHEAAAIITAHHQDDVLETALINVLRGTGRRGLTSLTSTPEILRPLLNMSKRDIEVYARTHGLHWREDATNQDVRYTRNYVRHRLLANADVMTRQRLLDIIANARTVNNELDTAIDSALHAHQTAEGLDRRWFTALPHVVAREVMAAWLRTEQLADFDRATIERLVLQSKTKAIGKRLDVRRHTSIVIGTDTLALDTSER